MPQARLMPSLAERTAGVRVGQGFMAKRVGRRPGALFEGRHPATTGQHHEGSGHARLAPSLVESGGQRRCTKCE